MKDFNKKIQEKFKWMTNPTSKLFQVALSGRDIWDLYLVAFDPKDNPMFRDPASSEHNCNHCKNFIRRYGNVVALIDNQIVTMFDIEDAGEYQLSANAMAKAIKASVVENVFFETFAELNSLPYESCTKKNEVFRLGVGENHKQYSKEEADKFGVVKAGQIMTFNHFHIDLPKAYVDMSGKSQEAIQAGYRDASHVFSRGMQEIPLDTLELVKDLINQGSLLDGQTHLWKVEQYITLKKEYDMLTPSLRANWCWTTSYGLPLAKFKNELIGVLCSELAEGEELNKACQSWNKRVDPINYMKTTAPITKKQIEEAKKFVEENGYIESFDRRLATIDDIKVSEILHSNVGNGKIKEVSIFDGVKSTSTRHKRNEFEGVETVHIDKFMTDILPGCTSIEAFLTADKRGNFVSLTTSNVKESKPIFKWDNNYSWTFNGNLAGKSMIKEAVKSRGGKVEGDLNIRLHFPNTINDYDLHVVEPKGGHIYFQNLRNVHASSGSLDLDAQGIDGHQQPDNRVENIIYTDKSKMPIGKYVVYVNNYSRNDSNHGFTVEIEIDGDVTTFNCNKAFRERANIAVCTIIWDGKDFTIDPDLEISNSNSISQEIYGLNTNEFHKVNLVCLSPNHWGQNMIGNKHYMFMLEGCKSPVNVRGFHNENLLPDLLEHKRVLEVLGTTSMVSTTEKQLSGIAFNATVRDEVILKLQGSFKRTVKVQF